MSKVLTSPVKKWPGTVTLADPLTWEQIIAWQDAVKDAQQHRGDNLRFLAAMRPGLVACVEKWELKNFTPPPAPFPATPTDSSGKLLVWLVREIGAIANEVGEEDPK
jgi:hypothetical protein